MTDERANDGAHGYAEAKLLQQVPNAPLTVLIVGAGPTGLTLACELARSGVSFRLIEAVPGPQPGSRGKGAWHIWSHEQGLVALCPLPRPTPSNTRPESRRNRTPSSA